MGRMVLTLEPKHSFNQTWVKLQFVVSLTELLTLK